MFSNEDGQGSSIKPTTVPDCNDGGVLAAVEDEILILNDWKQGVGSKVKHADCCGDIQESCNDDYKLQFPYIRIGCGSPSQVRLL